MNDFRAISIRELYTLWLGKVNFFNYRHTGVGGQKTPFQGKTRKNQWHFSLWIANLFITICMAIAHLNIKRRISRNTSTKRGDFKRILFNYFLIILVFRIFCVVLTSNAVGSLQCALSGCWQNAFNLITGISFNVLVP